MTRTKLSKIPKKLIFHLLLLFIFTLAVLSVGQTVQNKTSTNKPKTNIVKVDVAKMCQTNQTYECYKAAFIQSIKTDDIKGSLTTLKLLNDSNTTVRTYCHSLAHDLGAAVGCGAHVVELQRTRVGKFDIDESVELDEVTPESLIPLSRALDPMPMVQMSQGQIDRVNNGQWIKVGENPPVQNVALLDLEGDVVSVAKVDGNLLHPQCVLPKEALHGVV